MILSAKMGRSAVGGYKHKWLRGAEFGNLLFVGFRNSPFYRRADCSKKAEIQHFYTHNIVLAIQVDQDVGIIRVLDRNRLYNGGSGELDI